MKAYRRRARESNGYGPDRSFALLWSAVTVGLWLLWLINLMVNADRSRLGEWFVGSWSQISYWAFDALVGILFCVGVHAGRRWGFVGKAFHGSLSALSFVYFRQSSPVVLIELIAVGYCLLRLLGILGKRPKEKGEWPTFLPDRIVGLGFVLLNLEATLRILAKGVPSDSWPLGFYAWYGVSITELLWFDIAVIRSRGWTPAVGAALCIMGVTGLYYQPEERVQWLGAWMGLFYFSARLAGYGPRPTGVLGLASE